MPTAVQGKLRAKGWSFYTFLGDTGCRLMCAWDTSAETVDRFAAGSHTLCANCRYRTTDPSLFFRGVDRRYMD